MMPSYAAKRDRNEPELVRFARQLGAWMIRIDDPCDWLLWWRGWHLIEIKHPDCEGHADEYTPAQKAFRKEAAERGAKLVTWRTDQDVLATLGAVRAA